MGPKTASSPPFSIFPRLGFTPSRKTESSSRSPHAGEPEEDWYIPYNGPLEPSKGVSMANQDPFGYPVNQDDVNAFLEDSQLLDRYRDMSVNPAGPVGLGPPPAESTGFRGTRLRSDLTRRTTSSSSVIDTMRPHPRRRQMSAPRLQVFTHAGTDASADVGESPMPMQRITSTPQKKMSRFFGFGPSKKPRGQSTSTPIPPISQTTMPGAWLPSSIQHSTIQDNVNFAKPSANAGNQFDSHHSTLPPPSHRSHTHHRPPWVDAVNLSPSKGRSARYVDHHGNPNQDSSPSSPVTNYDSPTKFPSHPYANPSSSDSGIALRPSTSQQSHQEHQKLDSGSYNTHFSQNPTSRSRALTYVIDPRVPRATALATHATPSALPLKPSVSTPNLSAASHREQPSQPCKKPVAGTQRWLSAETWCDALFFPRPRLKVRRAHGRLGGSSGQLVSPPATPVAEGAPRRLSPAILGGRPRVLSATHDAVKEHHVLLKSRSAIDVLSGPSISGRPRTAPTPQRRRDLDPIQDISPKYAESVPGTSTVPQELCSSSPVPSLTQVLEEGEALEQQRKQWQHQASHSFGNSQTRSLSRTRARSLSRSQGHPGHNSEGSTALEFLAARTLLGGQSISPTVNVASTSHSRSYPHSTHSHNRSHSRQRSNSHSFTHSHSHSHSHSLAHSNSQKSSTDPQSTRHAPNESWGRTALLKACAPCGDRSNVHNSPVEGKRLALEPMTKNTKVIHLSDPTADSRNGADDGCVIIIGISPGPSTPSGEGVGIALSSPPPSDDHSRLSYDPELTSMPSHPYATGAVYTRYHDPSEEHDLQHTHKMSDYAGPHPSAYDSQLPPNTTARNVSMRHRLPPRAVQPGAISHPYAAAFTKPVTSHARQPSNSVLPTLSVPPSTVQHDKDFTSTHHISISSPDFGKYGVGEALVFAAPSRDEQETDSEDQPLGTAIPCQQDTLTRITDKGKAKGTTPPGSSQSRIPPLDSVIVSTRPPSLISVTTFEGGDSTHSPNTHPRFGPTPDITSAHLVISASENNELDEFQDLFYRPPVQSRSSSGKSSGRHQEASETSRGIPSDIHSSCSGSALTNLMRSISSGIGELHVTTSEFSHGQRSGGRSDELSQTYVFMDMSRTSSPVQADPPTVLHSPAQRYSVPFEGGVPEDVESSRASSLLMTSQENDTFGHPIRQDVVDAGGTSTILQGSRRASTHVSIHDAAEEVDLVSPISFIHSPLHSPDGVRSSYMTSASEYSHMSALYEFPDPPVQPNVTPNSASVLQIYDDAPTPPQQPENPREIIRRPGSGSRIFSLDSHRMTFGGGDDVDIITRVHKSER